MNKEDIVNPSEIIDEGVKLFAHLEVNDKTNDIRYEDLFSHLNLTTQYFFKIVENKGLDNFFLQIDRTFLKNVSEEAKCLFKKMIVNIILFHDVGKINPLFQKNKMNNKVSGLTNEIMIGFTDSAESRHSIVSAMLYIDYFYNDVMSLCKSDKEELRVFLLINGYIISRHHSDLKLFDEFLNIYNTGSSASRILDTIDSKYNKVYKHKISVTQNKGASLFKYTKKKFSNISEDGAIALYAYSRMIYSLLVASDYYATSEFMHGIKTDEFGDINQINLINSVFNDTDINRSIRHYKVTNFPKKKCELINERDINVLRCELFLEADSNLQKNMNKNIFFLEAPTGSGKSNVSINLALKLIENNESLNKIIEIYPFNTLVEQNLDTIKQIFGKTDIMSMVSVVNSTYPIRTENTNNVEGNNEEDYKYYEKAFLDRQFLNYPIMLTTHVSLFDTIFGSTKESAFGFHQLEGSVVILDEIQSYKNIIWSEIINFLSVLANIMNMKVIIMSATLPDLKLLLTDSNLKYKDIVTNLIEDRRRYFDNPLFKDRVTVNYELIDSKNIWEELKSRVLKYKDKKVIVEFIKKGSAYKFYNEIKDEISDDGPIVELLTGDDNVIERGRVIKLIKEYDEIQRRGIILISTQVIEAGVDIDMDIGFKDISKLDSEEQLMGRINRSCKGKGSVFFFNLDQENSIYKEDLRINRELSLRNKEMRDILANKDFERYYSIISENLISNFNESLGGYNIHEFFKNHVAMLDFKSISERMKLIPDDEWKRSVFFNRAVEICMEESGGKEKETIYGHEVWKEYKELLRDDKMEYSEKQVRLSEVRSKLNYFIYEINKNIEILYNDKIGELYYVENGEKYFTNNKLDMNKIQGELGRMI